jgi:excinuclease ABC subunit C
LEHKPPSPSVTTEDYQTLAPSLPKEPGVYRFVDAQGTILYIGKAKSLKNRLASYFGNRSDQRHKTRLLVKNADHIEYTIVGSEQDALLLENTLIKKHQPRYNVMLKDGKGYTYICIKNERFPRVFLTRQVIRDGSAYFGPYTSKTRIYTILELIKKLFPLRTCQFQLSEDNIAKGKFKVCLEYHIKNCNGPCAGLESEVEYNEKIEQIKNMLRGHFGEVKRHLKHLMQEQAENLDFEKAQATKEKLAAFEDYQGKSTVVSTNIRDLDVFSIASDEQCAYVNYIKVVNGAVINAYTQEMDKNLDEDEGDLLAYAIPAIRERFNSIAEEVAVPFELELPEREQLKITVPKIGDKKKLLELSEQNVKYFLLQKQKQELAKQQKKTAAERILGTLKKDLNMADTPLHIECFDNSNIQGAFPVSSCVVFRNARPSKQEYRHFNVKTVVGPNDFASMEEVVHRRYSRLLKEGTPLPQLVIIDGGKGQLASAMKSVRALGLEGKMTIIGIAKRLEELYFPDDPLPLYLNKKSESLKIIQQARDEAHRFAISFHRDQRSKEFTTTELTQIGGIGDKTAQKLLTHFGSVKGVREANYAQLFAVVGKKNAERVLDHFKKED